MRTYIIILIYERFKYLYKNPKYKIIRQLEYKLTAGKFFQSTRRLGAKQERTAQGAHFPVHTKTAEGSALQTPGPT